MEVNKNSIQENNDSLSSKENRSVKAPVINESVKSKPSILNQSPKIPSFKFPMAQLVRLLKKVAIIFSIIFIGLVLILIFLYLTKLDRKIFPITVHGVVEDNASLTPVSEATVKINNQTSKTNSKGEFSITGYYEDSLEIDVQAPQYKTFTQNINLDRNFFAFNFTTNVKLSPNGIGFLKGKIIAENGHEFTDDKILIDLNPIPIQEDGTFAATSLKKGKILFEYQSLKYKDIEKEVEIEEGANMMEELVVIPAGDVIGNFTDWVNDQSPVQAAIQADNVFQDQISVIENGDFVVKDLEPGKGYTFRITHSDYLSRDYKVNISQGENQIFNLRMIPNDIAASYIKRSESSNNQLFKSDLDGLNQEQVTNIRGFEASTIFRDNFIVYFKDNYENIRGINGVNLLLGYSIDLSNNKQIRLTTNTSQLQNLYYFFSANKLVNLTSTRNQSDTINKLEIRDIDGTNPELVTTGTNLTFTNLVVSKNNNIVFYAIRKDDTKVDDLYMWDQDTGKNDLLLTEEQINLYDVSPNAEIVLLTRKNSSTGLEDLVSFDVKARSARTLLSNHDGNSYTFDQDSKDIFYFYAKRDGRNNIFKYDLTTNQTTRVTFLNPDVSINEFYIVDRYLFYTVEKKLYVLDKNAPVSYKLVTEGLADTN